MVFDWDDFHDDNNLLEQFYELKDINPEFKCTVFAIPGRCSEDFLESLPDWMEVAVHGWLHPTPYECESWSAEYTRLVLDAPVIDRHFVHGWKSPGWQTSDGVYEEILRRGWWIADQHLEDGRRPAGIPTYFYEDGHWHGHIQNLGTNGIMETWVELREAVRNCENFEWASEVATAG